MFQIVAVYSPVLLKQGFTVEKELFDRELDAQVTLLPHKTVTREELYQHLAEADALLTDYQQVDTELLEHAPRLQMRLSSLHRVQCGGCPRGSKGGGGSVPCAGILYPGGSGTHHGPDAGFGAEPAALCDGGGTGNLGV